MAAKLLGLRGEWYRQVVCRFRIFDFFNPELGLAVEVDGPDHDPIKDAQSDRENLRKFSIQVVRVRNRNEEDASKAIREIERATTWEKRKGMPKPRRRMVMRGLCWVEKKPSIYGIYIPGKQPEYVVGRWRNAHKRVRRIPGAYGKKFSTLDQYYKWCSTLPG